MEQLKEENMKLKIALVKLAVEIAKLKQEKMYL
jgi:hypothetical protein